MAFDGWLVGHARWFSSAPGRKLIEFLRCRATQTLEQGKPQL
jgi:hypothetical protein